MNEFILKAYEGEEPFIFISYCNTDKEKVYPIMELFQKEGYRIWFDKGINSELEYHRKVFSETLEKSSAFIAFISNKFMESHNCRKEFNFAIMDEKKIFIIILEDVKFTPIMKIKISSVQVINYSEDENGKLFKEKFKDISVLSECKDNSINNRKKVKKNYLERKFTKEKIYISHNEFKIGRKKVLCDYAVEDNMTISKIHAILYLENDKCMIEDNNSTNKVYINDEEILAKKKVELNTEDFIELGSEKFIFREVEEEEPYEY